MSSTAVAWLGVKNVDFLHAPNYVNVTALGASSAVTLTIPAGAVLVELKASLVDVYVKWGSTGASTGAASDGTGSELVPLQSAGIRRNIGSTFATTSISVISTAAGTLTQSWWTL